MRRLLAFLLTGLACVLVGCTPPAPSDAAPSPTPPSSAAASPSTSPARAALSAFEARIREATTREGPVITDVAAMVAPATLRSPSVVLTAMRAWADGERQWLADHPADPCFDAAATKLAAAADAMTRSADGFAAVVGGSVPPASADPVGDAALADLLEVRRDLEDAAALAKTARTACG